MSDGGEKTASIFSFDDTLAPMSENNYPQGGDFLQIFTTNRPLFLSFNNGPAIEMSQGEIYNNNFSSFSISNTGPLQTAEYSIRIGRGGANPIDYKNPDRPIWSVSSETDVSCGAGVQTQIWSGVDYVTGMLVSFIGTAGEVVRVGSSTTGAAKGVAVPVNGVPISLPGSANLFVYNPNGTAVTATMTEQN